MLRIELDARSYNSAYTRTKTMEARPNTDEMANVMAGDTIGLFCGSRSMLVTVAKICRYASFEAMLAETNIIPLMPMVHAPERVLQALQAQHGVINAENGVVVIEFIFVTPP